MRILVTGAGGMIGRKLIERLAARGTLGGRAIEAVTAHDVAPVDPPDGAPFVVDPRPGDIADPSVAARLVEDRPEIIVHLAAIVSGQAEADFDKGYAVNLDGTRHLLEAVRAHGESYVPRFVFASSIAVFGAPFPDVIPDAFFLTPLTSYGTQKAMGELLVSDYSRRGLIEGLSIRLPTISVRPGKPNLAASGFFSNIIREPLKGEEAVLPVSDDVVHWHASPRAAVGYFLHAMTMDLDRVGPRRALTMPGLGVSVAEQMAALERVAGERAVALIRREPDETIARIVSGWPTRFEARRARDLGFEADESYDAIIRAHIEDEHGGEAPVLAA